MTQDWSLHYLGGLFGTESPPLNSTLDRYSLPWSSWYSSVRSVYVEMENFLSSTRWLYCAWNPVDKIHSTHRSETEAPEDSFCLTLVWNQRNR